MKFNNRQLQTQLWHWLNSTVRDDPYVQVLTDEDSMGQLVSICGRISRIGIIGRKREELDAS